MELEHGEKAMKSKVTLLNMMSGLILQFFTMVSGFIIPRIILTYFGSDVNGLISSLNQFLGYIGLLEGGITGVIVANLYKPIVENDNNKISSVLVTAKEFYRKIGILFIGYSIIVAFVYPLLIKSQFSYTYVWSLTLVLAITLFIQYMFSLTLKTLLEADKKNYVVNFVQCAIVISNVIFAFISVVIYPNVHILKLVSGVLFVFQPIAYKKFVDKSYKINWNAKKDNSLIASRWNGFAINFAAFIHNSTDITILTICADLKMVSIYSVYCLVSNGLKQLINACLSGISNTVGQAYAKVNWKEVNLKLDIYEYIVFILVFFLYTMAALLITPFVLLYTKGIIDTNYNQHIFGVLLCISEAMYLVKLPHLNLAYSANKFKEITRPAYIEAGINIIISVLLVGRFGVSGVAIGTIIAMAYRLVFQVHYTSSLIPERKVGNFYKRMGMFVCGSLISFFICSGIIELNTLSIRNWILHAIIYCVIVGSTFLVVSVIGFRKELRFLREYMIRK